MSNTSQRITHNCQIMSKIYTLYYEEAGEILSTEDFSSREQALSELWDLYSHLEKEGFRLQKRTNGFDMLYIGTYGVGAKNDIDLRIAYQLEMNYSTT